MSFETCSSDGCNKQAAEWLIVQGNPGHIHDCAEHAHDVREWCDVIDSGPLPDAPCPIANCTHGKPIWFGQPTPLAESTFEWES